MWDIEFFDPEGKEQIAIISQPSYGWDMLPKRQAFSKSIIINVFHIYLMIWYIYNIFIFYL